MESLAALLYELDLRRSEFFEVGHWDEASRGCLPKDLWGGLGQSVTYLPGRPQHYCAPYLTAGFILIGLFLQDRAPMYCLCFDGVGTQHSSMMFSAGARSPGQNPSLLSNHS